ncbi:MAG: SNF2-related protein, partial [Planctomycetia bacterium]
MTSLEKRLFHLFEKRDIAAARAAKAVRISCPRVGQVRSSVTDDTGETHDVLLELSAGRRGGMTLESRSTSPRGRSGKPCTALAATLLEVDRRGLFSSIHDHTPVSLEVVAADDAEGVVDDSGAGDDTVESGDATVSDDVDIAASRAALRVNAAAATAVARRGAARLPAWAVDLEERRRLVEPAVRAEALELVDGRRSTGALVFLLDVTASSDARAAVLLPCRMQVDVAGNATGRPQPVVIGPDADVAFETLDQRERAILAELVGTAAIGTTGGVEAIEHRTIARIAVSPQAAPAHLSLLCETGRLLVQPEPRRAPETVIPMTWDGGRPWEFALVLEPDDVVSYKAETLDEVGGEPRPPRRPAKATLRGMLVRGSQRKDLKEPRAILRSGLVVFADRLARVSVGGDGWGAPVRWLEQFERRGPIELAGSQTDGLIERLATLAEVPRLELPAWTGWRIESGPPRPKLVLDDTPAIDLEADEPAEPRRAGRRRAVPRVQLAGRIWFDYGVMQIAADDPAGGAADPARRVLVRRDRTAERAALSMLPRYGVVAPRRGDDGGEAPTHHVEIPRARLDASVAQLAAEGWAVEVAGRRYRPAGSVAWNVTSGIDWFELSGSIDFDGVVAEMPALLEALAKGERAVALPDGSVGILPEGFAESFEPMMALAEKHDGRLRYGRIQVALLDALLAGQPRSRVDEAFETIREELARGERPEAEPEPAGFTGTLRHYQREGLGWLAFLERTGLGGCLADDMGLGKTIQVLAMLVRRQ